MTEAMLFRKLRPFFNLTDFAEDQSIGIVLSVHLASENIACPESDRLMFQIPDGRDTLKIVIRTGRHIILHKCMEIFVRQDLPDTFRLSARDDLMISQILRSQLALLLLTKEIETASEGIDCHHIRRCDGFCSSPGSQR